MSKVLLVWETNPEGNEFYLLDEGSELAELAIKANGFFVNLPVNESVAIALSDALDKDKPEQATTPITNVTISTVVYSGFYL